MTTRRVFLKLICIVGVVASTAHFTLAAENNTNPNIVYILVDDMGWKDASCYGQNAWETPHIDKLASQGCRFTDAYAQPLCSPTRSSLLTGKHCARLMITDWLPGFRFPKTSNLVAPKQNKNVPLEEVTIAEVLQEAGYTTGLVGKWHIGHDPAEQGFDEVILKSDTGCPRFNKEGRFMTDIKGDAAIDFINRNKENPFFLYLSFNAVHLMLAASPEKIAKHPNAPNPTYAGMLEHVDDNVGRVLNTIHDLGMDDKTIVIFYSDNGAVTRCNFKPLLYTMNQPLRGNKGSVYEGGIRVPLIVRWPGVTQAGSTSDAQITSMDFYPTLLEMANLPLRPEQHLDGISFSGVFSGKPLDRKSLHWHFPHHSRHLMGFPSGAIRTGDWKLIEWFEDDKIELYNLKEDLGEQNNIAGNFPKKKKELLDDLRQWRKEVDAQMPARKKDIESK
jgi:arylsulfatase A-like enzyme